MWFQGVNESDFIIRGIKFSDYETLPSNVTLVDGEIGDKRIWIEIKSQKGYAIKVLFEFCGERIWNLFQWWRLCCVLYNFEQSY